MTQTWNPTILERDCEALTVPHGERVALTADVDEVDVTIVWDPPWNRERICEAARLELGLF
jgi:metal-sulfur cluster biosynthetic enzyme